VSPIRQTLQPAGPKGGEAPSTQLGTACHLLSVPPGALAPPADHERDRVALCSRVTGYHSRQTLKKVQSATAILRKLLQVAETSLWRLNASALLPAVYASAQYVDGMKQTAVNYEEVAA
jgi:hypothetical protein